MTADPLWFVSTGKTTIIGFQSELNRGISLFDFYETLTSLPSTQ